MELPAATTWGRADSLADHFARYGGDFGAATEAEYAERGSGLFQSGLREGLPTKINPRDGSIRIYDAVAHSWPPCRATGHRAGRLRPSSVSRNPRTPPPLQLRRRSVQGAMSATRRRSGRSRIRPHPWGALRGKWVWQASRHRE